MRRVSAKQCLILTATLLAAGTVRADMAVAVKTVDEINVVGRLVSLSLKAGLTIRLPKGESQKIGIDDLVRVLPSVTAAKPRRAQTTLFLSNGDFLLGKLQGKADDAISLETDDLGVIEAPLDSLYHLIVAKPKSAQYRQAKAWISGRKQADEDSILLRNGDGLQGFVTSIGTDGVLLETSDGEFTIQLEQVLAVRFATSPPRPTPKRLAVVTLRRSGRISADELDWSADEVSIRNPLGLSVRCKADDVVRVDLQGGRWEWLGSHEPISFEHTPMLSKNWHYQNNRNVLGGPLVVAGERFDYGIGVHSRCTLTYDLRGAYQTFVTSFGLDDDSGDYANVAAHILIDGKRRLREPHVTPGTLFGPFRLDVNHAKRIELIVDFGDNGDLQDRFNWIEPAVVR